MDSVTRANLKQLLSSQHWGDIYRFVALVQDKWHNENIKHDDEFNTMWAVASQKAKVEGLREFFDELENEILNKD